MEIIMRQQPKYDIFFSLQVNQVQKVASVMKKSNLNIWKK